MDIAKYQPQNRLIIGIVNEAKVKGIIRLDCFFSLLLAMATFAKAQSSKKKRFEVVSLQI